MMDYQFSSLNGLKNLDELPTPNQVELLAEFERRRKARQIVVSTDDNEVKLNLRKLSEPICLFGEGPADRRERLRNLISRLSEDEIAQKLKKKEEQQKRDEEKQDEVTWYHEGEEVVRLSREWIAAYSLKNAKERLTKAKHNLQLSELERNSKIQEDNKHIRGFSNYCSQIGDQRPLSYCSFSPNSKLLAISSWSGVCKLWTVPDCNVVRTYNGHNCNASSIVFHPQSTLTQDESALNLVSTGFDGSVRLWNLNSETSIGSLNGHEVRVSKAEFHPSGKYLATCSHDHTWRLWDLEKSEEIYIQEGHSRPVLDISFQCDGSIAATGGQDAYGRIWDLRTGRCIMFMEGHLKTILSVDFNPNGYQLATGSEDNTVKIWDLRQSKCIYTIPAHKNLVSKVRFQSKYNLKPPHLYSYPYSPFLSLL
jgi:U4/U6 small nuclear ribonucleoprotein PRP4